MTTLSTFVRLWMSFVLCGRYPAGRSLMEGKVKGGMLCVTYRGVLVLVLHVTSTVAAKDTDVAVEVPETVAPVIKRDIYPLYWTKKGDKLWFLDNDVFWLSLTLAQLGH